MGRYLKNKELRSAGYSIRAPQGYSALGHGSPVNGLFRLNKDTAKLEYFSNGSWRIIAIEGDVGILKDTFTGDGTARRYGPMSIAYTSGSEALMMVYIGNVFQNPGIAYTVDGNFLTFTSTPNNLQPIVVLHGYASTKVPL
jgi:hypothetical protein